MAPSSGHVLVPKVVTAFKYAISKTSQAIRSRLAQVQQQQAVAQPIAIPIRNAARHPIHPFAALRQSRSGQVRGFATSIRAALTETYPSLRAAVRNSPSRTITLARAPTAPTFGSALRPRLTGGAIPRTAGGYVAIGGRRAFSHVPNAQAQVLANVSAGVRAFWLGGQRAQFDGMDKRTGEKRFVAVGTEAHKAGRKLAGSKAGSDVRGTSLEFCVAPELTSLQRGAGTRKSKSRKSGKGAKAELPSVVAPLATDFARSLGVMAAVHRDLKLLSKLGDLPISEPRPGWIAVRFAGCDGRSVERLCDELGVCRGIVREDEAWAEEQAQDVKMALLFPTAPSDGPGEEEEGDDAMGCFYDRASQPASDMILLDSLDGEGGFRSDGEFTADETLSPLESLHGGSFSDGSSRRHDYEHLSNPASMLSWQPNPWAVEMEARSSFSDDDVAGGGSVGGSVRNESRSFQGVSTASQELENIYRFISECDGRLGMPTSTHL